MIVMKCWGSSLRNAWALDRVAKLTFARDVPRETDMENRFVTRPSGQEEEE